MKANIYYNPEKFGFETVGEIDVADSYEFDTFVLWRNKQTGLLYCSHDSGCSCPVPFEDIGVDNLIKIDSEETLKKEIEKAFQYNKPTFERISALVRKAFPEKKW